MRLSGCCLSVCVWRRAHETYQAWCSSSLPDGPADVPAEAPGRWEARQKTETVYTSWWDVDTHKLFLVRLQPGDLISVCLSWTYIPSITGHVISSPPFTYPVLVNSPRINECINKTERQIWVCASAMGCNPDEFINPTEHRWEYGTLC